MCWRHIVVSVCMSVSVTLISLRALKCWQVRGSTGIAWCCRGAFQTYQMTKSAHHEFPCILKLGFIEQLQTIDNKHAILGYYIANLIWPLIFLAHAQMVHMLITLYRFSIKLLTHDYLLAPLHDYGWCMSYACILSDLGCFMLVLLVIWTSTQASVLNYSAIDSIAVMF